MSQRRARYGAKFFVVCFRVASGSGRANVVVAPVSCIFRVPAAGGAEFGLGFLAAAPCTSSAKVLVFL